MGWEFAPPECLQAPAAALTSGQTVDQEFIAGGDGVIRRIFARAMAAAVTNGAIVTISVLVNGTAAAVTVVVNNAKGTALQEAAPLVRVAKGDRIVIRAVESGATGTTALVGRGIDIDRDADR